MNYTKVTEPCVTTRLVFPSPDGDVVLPEWMRTLHVTEAGEVFYPAEAVARTAALVAMFDGARGLEEGGHLYLPTTWLRREFPDWDDVMAAAEKAAGEALAADEQPANSGGLGISERHKEQLVALLDSLDAEGDGVTSHITSALRESLEVQP